MLLANLCVKNPDPFVKYNFTNPFVIKQEIISCNNTFKNVNFHIPTLIKEVKQLPKNTIKEYKRTIKMFIVTASSFMMLPLKSMANTLPSTQTVGTNLPKSATGMPPEILDLLLKLLVISVGSAVILAAILLVAAGVMKMLRKRKEASEWTVDIIKGLVQILVAVPVVFLIYYAANLLFQGSGWFVSPF